MTPTAQRYFHELPVTTGTYKHINIWWSDFKMTTEYYMW